MEICRIDEDEFRRIFRERRNWLHFLRLYLNIFFYFIIIFYNVQSLKNTNKKIWCINHLTLFFTVFLLVWFSIYYSYIIYSLRNYYSYSCSTLFFSFCFVVLFIFVWRIILLLFFYVIGVYYVGMGFGYRVSLWRRGFRFMWSCLEVYLLMFVLELENIFSLRLWIRNIDVGLSYLDMRLELF